jgi:hypothetical protein
MKFENKPAAEQGRWRESSMWESALASQVTLGKALNPLSLSLAYLLGPSRNGKV